MVKDVDEYQNQKLDELSKDFVIDYSTNINRGFRKWNSGLLECWGEVKEPVANSITSPFAHEFSVILPTIMVSPRYVGGQASSVGFRYISTASYKLAGAYVRDISTNQAPTVGEACFTYYAIGRWK